MSGSGGKVHPVAGSQVSFVHGFPSLHNAGDSTQPNGFTHVDVTQEFDATQETGWPTQTPLKQVSPVVQASTSSHGLKLAGTKASLALSGAHVRHALAGDVSPSA